jgi:hypothetical protein
VAEPYLTYQGARVVMPAWLVTQGASPDHCLLHGRSGATRTVTFCADPPLWSYFLLLFGVLPGLLALWFVRKRLTASEWTCCPTCHRDRRIGITVLVSVAISWPLLLMWVLADRTLADRAGLQGVALLVVVLVPLFLVLGFGHMVSQRRMVGGVLSSDGSILTLPASAFPPAGSAGTAASATSVGQSVLPER